MIVSTSSDVGGSQVFEVYTKLMGSNSRERERDKYAFSKSPSVSRSAFSELQYNSERAQNI